MFGTGLRRQGQKRLVREKGGLARQSSQLTSLPAPPRVC